MSTKTICLIGVAECGLKEGSPKCEKCGMDVQSVYPGVLDLEMAQSNARAQYWEAQAKTLESDVVDLSKQLKRAQASLKREQDRLVVALQDAEALSEKASSMNSKLRQAKASAAQDASRIRELEGQVKAHLSKAKRVQAEGAPAKSALSPQSAWPFPTGDKA